MAVGVLYNPDRPLHWMAVVAGRKLLPIQHGGLRRGHILLRWATGWVRCDVDNNGGLPLASDRLRSRFS